MDIPGGHRMLYKEHAITLDIKRPTKVALQGIVAGETGNRITVMLKNGDEFIPLTGLRVCLRVRSDIGERMQNEENGISVENDKAVILLSPNSFAEGMNRARLMVYSSENSTDEILIYSAEFQFDAA